MTSEPEIVPSLTKSDLIDKLSQKQRNLSPEDVETAIKELIKMMSNSLATGERIEIRGFGSFSLHYRPQRSGRNPKSGESVNIPEKYIPRFRPGKEMRDRVNIL